VTVESRVYDIVNVSGGDYDYDYVTFDIINHARKRVLSFSLFLDELVHSSEKISKCLTRCSCKPCQDLNDLEVSYVEGIGAQYPNWPIDLETVFSPRAFKFTETKQVESERPKDYKKPSQFISESELVAIFQALQEALKRHHDSCGSKPYLAMPVNRRVDSMYQKVLTQKLEVDLQFDITRTTINESNALEAIYVVQ
jgi:hypothetical protein